MREFLKIIELDNPMNFVFFDYNPEQLKIQRSVKAGSLSRPSARGRSGSTSTGGNAGTSATVNNGNEPQKMSLTKARLVGPETKPMCDRLLGWLSPKKAGLGTAALLARTDNQVFLNPIVIVQWGPPLMGFLFHAQFKSVTINYTRVSSVGIPSAAMVDITLEEVPSKLPGTNPTSGGRPGRSRHLVTAGENLTSIAHQAFGTPAAWRTIAEINGIDDPTAVRPGDAVYLPAVEELAELRLSGGAGQ